MRKQAPFLAAAIIAALLALVATYAVLRTRDVFAGGEPNPATIVWSAKIAMFWRVGIGAYVGGMVAFVAYIAARRHLARTMKTLYVLTLVAAAMIGLQGSLLP